MSKIQKIKNEHSAPLGRPVESNKDIQIINAELLCRYMYVHVDMYVYTAYSCSSMKERILYSIRGKAEEEREKDREIARARETEHPLFYLYVYVY